jgi:uncharacterized protein with PQ loop repeat
VTDAAITIAIVAANLAGMVMVLPQAVRVIRTGLVAGVSPAWAGTGIAFNTWWLAYGVAVPRPAVIPVSAVSVTVYIVLAVGLVRHRPPARRPLAGALGTGFGATAAVLAVQGWATVGVFLGLAYGVQLLPAVISAWRSADTSGIARATWVIAWTEAALWGVAGLGRADAGLVVAALSGTTMAGLVLAATVRGTRPRARLSWRPA